MARTFNSLLATAVPAIATVALVLSLAGTAVADEGQVCGDVNDSGDVTSSDALSVLRKAVGQNLNLVCGIENRFGDTDDYNETAIIQPNHLLGQLINVPRASTLTHWGIITRKGGGQVRFALYTDDGGTPGELVTGSLVQPLQLGVHEIVTGAPKSLAAGNYWLMANFDSVTESPATRTPATTTSSSTRRRRTSGTPARSVRRSSIRGSGSTTGSRC